MKDFLEVPGCSNYLVSPTGVVILKSNRKPLRPWINPAGYCYFKMTKDDGSKTLFARHRLMLLTFKPPSGDPDALVVNHINGIKGYDTLDNLEWCTARENVERAGQLGITTKCIPVSIRCVKTGKVTDFPSMVTCATALGISKDAVAWRCRYGETKVFPGGYQFRLGAGETTWFEFPDPQLALELAVSSKPIVVKNHDTGKEELVDSLSRLSEKLGLTESALSIRLNKYHHPILLGKYQVRWLCDLRPWREPVKSEFHSFKGSRRVRVTFHNTGETKTFRSCKECADALGLRTTTLNLRLGKGSSWVFRDGTSFEYIDAM